MFGFVTQVMTTRRKRKRAKVTARRRCPPAETTSCTSWLSSGRSCSLSFHLQVRHTRPVSVLYLHLLLLLLLSFIWSKSQGYKKEGQCFLFVAHKCQKGSNLRWYELLENRRTRSHFLLIWAAFCAILVEALFRSFVCRVEAIFCLKERRVNRTSLNLVSH